VAYNGRLPVPVNSVNIPGVFLIRIGEDVPAYPLAHAHGEHRAIPFKVAVDRIEVMELVNPDESTAKSVSTDFSGRLVFSMSASRTGVTDSDSRQPKIEL